MVSLGRNYKQDIQRPVSFKNSLGFQNPLADSLAAVTATSTSSETSLIPRQLGYVENDYFDYLGAQRIMFDESSSNKLITIHFNTGQARTVRESVLMLSFTAPVLTNAQSAEFELVRCARIAMIERVSMTMGKNNAEFFQTNIEMSDLFFTLIDHTHWIHEMHEVRSNYVQHMLSLVGYSPSNRYVLTNVQSEHDFTQSVINSLQEYRWMIPLVFIHEFFKDPIPMDTDITLNFYLKPLRKFCYRRASVTPAATLPSTLYLTFNQSSSYLFHLQVEPALDLQQLETQIREDTGILSYVGDWERHSHALITGQREHTIEITKNTRAPQRILLAYRKPIIDIDVNGALNEDAERETYLASIDRIILHNVSGLTNQSYTYFFRHGDWQTRYASIKNPWNLNLQCSMMNNRALKSGKGSTWDPEYERAYSLTTHIPGVTNSFRGIQHDACDMFFPDSRNSVFAIDLSPAGYRPYRSEFPPCTSTVSLQIIYESPIGTAGTRNANLNQLDIYLEYRKVIQLNNGLEFNFVYANDVVGVTH